MESTGISSNPIVIGVLALVLVLVFVAAIYTVMRYYMSTTNGLLGTSLALNSSDAAGAIRAMSVPTSTQLDAAGGSSLPGGPAPVDSSSSLLGGLAANLESAGHAVHIGGTEEEVYNISENIYQYADAAAVCSAFNGRLATMDDMEKAYKNGADWCNYGWIQGQLAVYPTQKATWEKLQKGSKSQRNNCGIPGLNGGKFDNPELRFGVNCYGVRPVQKDSDKIVAPVRTADMIEYDQKVADYKSKLGSIGVLPFQPGVWTQV